MTLWDMPKNSKATVTGLNTEILSDLQLRLNEMGFMPGEMLTCIKRSPFNGPLVIQIQDCVYSLDKQLAMHIRVAN
jgi:Fe2+ transport system protein FeoA